MCGDPFTVSVSGARNSEGHEFGILKGMNPFVATAMWARPDSLLECTNRSAGMLKGYECVAYPGVGRDAEEEC